MVDARVMKLMENIPEDRPVSVFSLSHSSGLDRRTVKSYLETIEEIQKSRKVVRQQVGLRTLVKKERQTPQTAPSLAHK